MNWLAHTLLSKKNIEYQLGNVLADPLRGVSWKGASVAMIQGMKMHKAIDKYTDRHAIFYSSKEKLGVNGHLKGVVLDLLYDHFLSKSWSHYSSVSLDDFLQGFNQQALASSESFPDKAKKIVDRMAATNLLGKYQDFTGLELALERIDQRLSARVFARERATQYIPVVKQQYEYLKMDFDIFFPQLVRYFKSHKLGSLHDHYLL